MAKIIEDRDNRILNAAIDLAKEDGYQWITRDAVAQRAGVSPATINNVFTTMVGLKRAVLAAAVERSLVDIVAQGLADRHPIALEAPAELKAQAAALIMVA